MKTFTDLINEHYISSFDELNTYLTESNQLQQKNQALKAVTHVVLIGEMKYSSMKHQTVKLDYADPTKLSYKLEENSIYIDDGEYNFTLTPADVENTLVFVRSGYKNPTIAYLLKEIIKMGILVLNDPDCVNLTNNKYLTALLLDKYKLPQPKYALVTKDDIHKGDSKNLDKKLATIYKKVEDDNIFICKILGGHGGKGVFKCTGFNIMSVLQAIFAIKEDTNILVQEYKKIKDGDVRAHVLTLNDKQVIVSTSMRLKGSKDFRTNLSLGNSEKEYELTPEQEELVKQVAKASGLVWAGVDMLPLEDGSNIIIEINGAPGTPVEVQSDDIKEQNEAFWKKFIETINSLC